MNSTLVHFFSRYSTLNTAAGYKNLVKANESACIERKFLLTQVYNHGQYIHEGEELQTENERINEVRVDERKENRGHRQEGDEAASGVHPRAKNDEYDAER